jgi:hypothetical protein
MDEAEKVFDVVFPSSDEAAVVLHPGKDAFDLPSAPVAAQRTAILCPLLAVRSVGRDHLDAVVGREFFIERIRVVGLVADESCGQLVEEASGQNIFHKLALGR